MKKVSLLTSFVFAFGLLMGQMNPSFSLLPEGSDFGINQGQVVAMGNIGFSTNTDKTINGSTTNTSKANLFNMNIGAMYMIQQYIGIGLAILAYNNAVLFNGDKTSKLALFGAAVFARYYWPLFMNRLFFYGMVRFALSGGNEIFYSNGQEQGKDKVSVIGASLNPGFSYFLMPALALEMNFGLLGWQQQTNKNSENSDQKRVVSDFQILAFTKTLTIGFCWWF